MSTISFLKPYSDFSSNQSFEYDEWLIEDSLYDFIDNKPNYSKGFIISDMDNVHLTKRKVSSFSNIAHGLCLSKNDCIEDGEESVNIVTNVYIALIFHKRNNKALFDFAPYLVTMNVYKKDKYDLSATFYPHDIDVVNDAVALGAEAEVMKITSDSAIQNAIPDILYKNFIAATEVIYDICKDLFLLN